MSKGVLRVIASLSTGAILLISARPVGAAEWHVTPTGTPGGDGSLEAPWDLATVAFGGAGVVEPGDTVWMHAGTYGDGGNLPIDFVMYGEPDAPILVRAVPADRDFEAGKRIGISKLENGLRAEASSA